MDKRQRLAGETDARLRADLAAEIEARGLQLADWEPVDVAEIRAEGRHGAVVPAGVDALTGRECKALLARIGRHPE